MYIGSYALCSAYLENTKQQQSKRRGACEMARERQFELLDSMVPRNRTVRFMEFVTVQAATGYGTWWFSDFFLRDLFIEFYSPSTLSFQAADATLIGLGLAVSATGFLKTIHHQMAMTDPNQILIALSAFGWQVMFGPGMKFKLFIDFLSKKNALTVSLEAKKSSWRTVEDPDTAATLDSNIRYSFSFSFYALITAIQNLQQRTIGAAVDNVRAIINASVQNAFKLLTTEEALINKDVIAMAATLLLEAKTVWELEIDLYLLFRDNLWFDPDYRGRQSTNIENTREGTRMELINGFVRALEHYFKDLKITNDHGCSICDSLGLVIDVLRFDSIAHPLTVQKAREKRVTIDLLREGTMAALGINPNDEGAYTLLYTAMELHPEQYSQALQTALLAFNPKNTTMHLHGYRADGIPIKQILSAVERMAQMYFGSKNVSGTVTTPPN